MRLFGTKPVSIIMKQRGCLLEEYMSGCGPFSSVVWDIT